MEVVCYLLYLIKKLKLMFIFRFDVTKVSVLSVCDTATVNHSPFHLLMIYVCFKNTQRGKLFSMNWVIHYD